MKIMKEMKNKNWKYLITVLLLFVGCNTLVKAMSDDMERIRIVSSSGNQEIGQNREDNVPYEVYVNRSTGTLEVVSFDTKPATVYLCDAAGNIVNTLYFPDEGFYALQLPSGYSHLYIMIMSSDIYYGEITL